MRYSVWKDKSIDGETVKITVARCRNENCVNAIVLTGKASEKEVYRAALKSEWVGDYCSEVHKNEQEAIDLIETKKTIRQNYIDEGINYDELVKTIIEGQNVKI